MINALSFVPLISNYSHCLIPFHGNFTKLTIKVFVLITYTCIYFSTGGVISVQNKLKKVRNERKELTSVKNDFKLLSRCSNANFCIVSERHLKEQRWRVNTKYKFVLKNKNGSS